MNLSRLPGLLNWSLRVGRLFGIPIFLHVTILFFLWPAFESWRSGPGLALEWAVGIVLSILLHEFGHALVAKRYGLSGITITLHGLGGFAMSNGPRTPRQALVIALAGPAATFFIGGAATLAGRYGLPNATSEVAFKQFWLLAGLGQFNLLLGLLNLIPSLPFDGGNALRAILAHRTSEFKATRAVAHLGLLLCPALFVYALVTQRAYLELFGFFGAITSLSILLQTGGVRFGEPFADRKHRQEVEAVRRREAARTEVFRDEVAVRQRERDERERLRDLFERSGIDDR